MFWSSLPGYSHTIKLFFSSIMYFNNFLFYIWTSISICTFLVDFMTVRWNYIIVCKYISLHIYLNLLNDGWEPLFSLWIVQSTETRFCMKYMYSKSKIKWVLQINEYTKRQKWKIFQNLEPMYMSNEWKTTWTR